MAKVYAELIRKGLKTLDDVPERLREEVRRILEEDEVGGVKRLRLFLLTILCGKEVADMAIVYATLIVKGKKTLDQVPALIKPQVEEILKDLEVEI